MRKHELSHHHHHHHLLLLLHTNIIGIPLEKVSSPLSISLLSPSLPILSLSLLSFLNPPSVLISIFLSLHSSYSLPDVCYLLLLRATIVQKIQNRWSPVCLSFLHLLLFLIPLLSIRFFLISSSLFSLLSSSSSPFSSTLQCSQSRCNAPFISSSTPTHRLEESLALSLSSSRMHFLFFL